MLAINLFITRETSLSNHLTFCDQNTCTEWLIVVKNTNEVKLSWTMLNNMLGLISQLHRWSGSTHWSVTYLVAMIGNKKPNKFILHVYHVCICIDTTSLPESIFQGEYIWFEFSFPFSSLDTVPKLMISIYRTIYLE